MDKTHRYALIAGVLMAAFGIFYHYVIFIPRLESEKTAATELKENQRKVAYSDCLRSARTVYDDDWTRVCKSDAGATRRKLENCLTDKSILQNQFMGEKYCKQTFVQTEFSAECTLPKSQAEFLNAQFKQSKEKCQQEARLGLE